jgi:hypothetical protein
MISPIESSPQMPPDLRRILDTDPRLEGFKESPTDIVTPQKVLKPSNPPRAEESSLVLFDLNPEDTYGKITLVNPPGQGKDMPRVHEACKKPSRRSDVFPYMNWLVVSRTFVDVVNRFAPGAIKAIPVDWQFEDGKLEGAHLLDVTALVDAYDYERSELLVSAKYGQRLFRSMGFPRAIKSGAEKGVHICRDSFVRHDILVSRELARALASAALRGFVFRELATGGRFELDYAD